MTSKNILEYQTFGVTVVRDAISNEWIRRLKQGVELARDHPGPYAEYLHDNRDGHDDENSCGEQEEVQLSPVSNQESGIYFTDLELSTRLTVFQDFAINGPCSSIVGQVMNTTTYIRYFYDQVSTSTFPDGASLSASLLFPHLSLSLHVSFCRFSSCFPLYYFRL